MIKKQYIKFSQKYPFLINSQLLEYFSIFGGLEDCCAFNFLTQSKEESLLELANSTIVYDNFPFFIFQEPFRSFLINLTRSDAKRATVSKKSKIGFDLTTSIIDELLANNIIRVVQSREEPLQEYPKQKIKKEFKDYKIEPKIYFNYPILRFWFRFVEPFRDSNGLKDEKEFLNKFRQRDIKLYSIVFEHLSIEVLKQYFSRLNIKMQCNSFWDIHSEFDMYCKSSNEKYIVGECKYSNRPITKAQLLKLEYKIEQSNLNSDYIVFFAKSGYSKELEKLKSKTLLLFTLDDLKLLN